MRPGVLIAEVANRWPYSYAHLIESGYIAALVEQVFAFDFENDPDDRAHVRIQLHRAIVTLAWEMTDEQA